MGMTELLLDSQLNDRQHQFAKIIHISAQSLLTVLNDILDFSKIEANKLTIESIPFDLGLAVDDVVDLMVGKADDKNIELIVRLAPDVPLRVIGDPGRIRQVLINLASNAIKFTDAGYVFIDVKVLEQTEDSVQIQMSVEDTGIGVPADKRKEIFEKFTQANGSITRKYGGTGLGLAIAKQLVEMMGGEIYLRTKPGIGSTFSFVLDLPLDLEAPADPLPTASLEGVRILVIHSHEVARRVLVEQISNWGARAHACTSGHEAFSAVRKAAESGDPFAMAIVSYNMTDMSVEEFARRVKGDPRSHDLSLVMLTPVGQKGDVERLKAVGFDAYVMWRTRSSRLFDTLATVRGVKERGIKTVMITRHTLSERQPTRRPDTRFPDDHPVHAYVLLAEDNITNQEVLVKVLESIGCQVDVASNGLEAVSMLKMKSYDAVIMDCQMPEMDGFAATREIRRQERDSSDRIPIIGMTANALADQRERCLTAGMDEYLRKPVKKEHLRDTLARYVGQRAG